MSAFRALSSVDKFMQEPERDYVSDRVAIPDFTLEILLVKSRFCLRNELAFSMGPLRK
jgi:hypothetical protein